MKKQLLFILSLLMLGLSESQASSTLTQGYPNPFLEAFGGNIESYRIDLKKRAQALGDAALTKQALDMEYKSYIKYCGEKIDQLADEVSQVKDNIKYQFQTRQCSDALKKVSEYIDNPGAVGKVDPRALAGAKLAALRRSKTAVDLKPIDMSKVKALGGLADVARKPDTGGPASDLLAGAERVAPKKENK